MELQSRINQRNAAEKAATSSGCTNQGGAIRGGEKKNVAGDILILLNDGKEHQSAQSIFLPNFCHDGLGCLLIRQWDASQTPQSRVVSGTVLFRECFSSYD